MKIVLLVLALIASLSAMGAKGDKKISLNIVWAALFIASFLV